MQLTALFSSASRVCIHNKADTRRALHPHSVAAPDRLQPWSWCFLKRVRELLNNRLAKSSPNKLHNSDCRLSPSRHYIQSTRGHIRYIKVGISRYSFNNIYIQSRIHCVDSFVVKKTKYFGFVPNHWFQSLMWKEMQMYVLCS